MKFKIKVSTHFKCSLERAFKTPVLCDVTKVHRGFGIIPKVTHTTNDNHWGKEGSSKKIYVAKSIFQKAGFAARDRIVKRIENEYWIIQLDEFQSRMSGFYSFVGKWETTEIEDRIILVEYTYFLYSKSSIFYPMHWIFANTFWKSYMKKVLENIKNMVYNEEPYKYD